MRHDLEKKCGDRLRFRAVFDRYGSKKGWTGHEETTVLLKDVVFVENGSAATDHIWFSCGKTISRSFSQLKVKSGDVIEFDARITTYVKGFVDRRNYIDNRTIDFKLSNPTKIQKVC